ncbi:hypothetical protein CPB86DRAFT_756304 [Serendipita vermifera]|nr:hypothetical protein CPB86DRAFT_756304 [Serendipita vermifera]
MFRALMTAIAEAWAISSLCMRYAEREKVRAMNGLWKRITVLLVNDEEDMAKYTNDLSLYQTGLDIVNAGQLQAESEDVRWRQIMKIDVLVTHFQSFMDDINDGLIAFSQINLMIVRQSELAVQSGLPLHTIMANLAKVPPAEKPRLLGIISHKVTEAEFSNDHLQLEGLFMAQIRGISDSTRSKVADGYVRLKELVIRFDPPNKVVDTALCKHLRTFDQRQEVYRAEFKAAKTVLREVGSFASDWVWRRAFKQMEESPLSNNLEDEDDIMNDSDVKIAKTKQGVYKTIKNWTFTLPNLDPSSKGFNVSPKIAKLVKIIQCFRHEGDGFRGILIVRRRITAQAIVEVFKTISEHIPFVRPEAVTGPWSNVDSSKDSILDDFLSGICNFMVVTKSSLESLQIPVCTCIISYDLFDCNVSYAHIRTIAQETQCHLIFMLDKNADMGRRIIRQIARLPEEVRKWTQTMATDKSGILPPGSIMQTTDTYHSASEEEGEGVSAYLLDPLMSGRIYPQDAVSVLYRFLATVNPRNEPDATEWHLFHFHITTSPQKGYVCTVTLPVWSPIQRIVGPISVSQPVAKQAASFEACRQLQTLGILPYTLFPRPREVARRLRPVAVFIDEEVEQTKGDILPILPPAPAPPNALDSSQVIDDQILKSQKMSGTRCYKRKFPEFWKNALECRHEFYYPTIVTVDRNHNPLKPYRPVLIITRAPLPEVEDFKLHFASMPSVTYLRPARPFHLAIDQLKHLHGYTLRVMRTISNKPFTCPMEDMPFFLAPLDFGWDIDLGKMGSSWPFPDVSDYIPWDLVIFASEQYMVPLNTDSIEALEEDIKDAVVQDWRTEFTRRFDCMRMRRDLNPLSPMDLGKGKKFNNLIDLCKAKRKGFEGVLDNDQPLIEVSSLPGLVNRLSPIARQNTDTTSGIVYSAKYVIPELCSKFTIPASTMRTLSLLPSVMKRIDDTLIVRELNAMYFNNEINETLLHAAITTPSAGFDFDYERLELLGDAYLKYLSSIYLFVTNPNQHEGILHIARQKIISNKALLVNADKSGLPQYIQAKPFLPKLWVPKGYTPIKAGDSAMNIEVSVNNLEPGLEAGSGPAEIDKDEGSAENAPGPIKDAKPKTKKALQDDSHLWLGDKCVADVAEAIIGAAFQTGGAEMALKVVKSLHIPLPFIESWEDFSLKAKAPPPDLTIALDDHILESVESTIGARFERPHILAQALTHTSVRGNDMTCYERLEFLGDAILDFLVIQHIFDLYGRLSPGALTLLKGSMVSNSCLAAVSVHYGLHKFLMIESNGIKRAIEQYVPELEEKKRAEYEAADREGRPRGQYWLDVEPPKSIADVVESIFGALYVSDGFKLKGVQAMYDTLLKPFYDQHISLKTMSHHPTKILFELLQSQGCQEFEMTRRLDKAAQLIRCEIVVHDVILAIGADSSATVASKYASFEALDALEGDPDFMPRVCDCRSRAEQRKGEKKARKSQLDKAEPGTSAEESAGEDEEMDGEI